MRNFSTDNENENPKELDFAQAKKRAINWFSRRDYSEMEIIEKLARVTSPGVAEQTLKWCHQQRLIMTPQAMTEMMIDKLRRQKKGIEQINMQLIAKGLDSVTADDESELENSSDLIAKKFKQILRSKSWSSLDLASKQNTKAKVFRFLATRGFTSEIINSSFEKWLQTNKDMDDDEFD